MFRLLYIALMICCGLKASERLVDVSVPIGSLTDTEVRQLAKLKVKEKTIERLPLIMSGNEHFVDGALSTEIKAISLGQIDVSFVSESWDREGNTYTATAIGELDEEKTLKMVEGVIDNKVLQQRLRDAYEAIVNLSDRNTSKEWIDSQVEILDIQKGLLVRESLASSVEAHAQYVDKLQALFIDVYVTKLKNSMVVSLDRVTDKYIHFSLEGTEVFESTLEEANLFYQERFKGTYKVGADICVMFNGELVSPVMMEYSHGYVLNNKRKRAFGGEEWPSFSMSHGGDEELFIKFDGLVSLKRCFLQ